MLQVRNCIFSAAALLLVSFSCHILQAQNKWTQLGPHAQVVDITSATGKIYVLTDSSLYVSSDEKNWMKIRDLPQGESYNSVVVLSSGEIFLFSYDWYLESKDVGTTWNRVGQSGFSTRRVIADTKGYLYSGQNNPIKRSTDKGVTWTDSKTGTSADFFDIATFAVGPSGDIYAGNQGITGGMVYRSTDHGDHWKLIHSESLMDVTTIAVGLNGSIYVAYADNLILSDDNGSTWSFLSPMTPNRIITAMSIPVENDVYAGMEQVGSIYSGDRGYTWDSTANGVRGKHVAKYLITPANHLIVGTDSGLFIQGGLGVERQSSANTDLLFYPNPVNSKGALTIETGTPSRSRIHIVDFLGRELVVPSLQIGQGTIQVNLSKAAPGLYVISSESGTVLKRGKLLISH